MINIVHFTYYKPCDLTGANADYPGEVAKALKRWSGSGARESERERERERERARERERERGGY